MFERETHREKILEARAKELRVKARQRAVAEATTIEADADGSQNQRIIESSESAEKLQKEAKERVCSVFDCISVVYPNGKESIFKRPLTIKGGEGVESVSQEQVSPEELLKQVEWDFFEQIEEERRERERQNNDRNRRSESLNDAADEVEEEEELEEETDDEGENQTSINDTGGEAGEADDTRNPDVSEAIRTNNRLCFDSSHVSSCFRTHANRKRRS